MTRNDVHRLENAGFRSAGDGTVVLSGPARLLFQGWLRLLPAVLGGHADTAVHAPLFIAREVLETSRYLAHFPHQIIRCRRGNLGACLTPAACLHIYPALAGRRFAVGESHSTLVLARCARYEGGTWSFPFRLSDFHMMEVVVVGDGKRVMAARVRVAHVTRSLFSAFQIPGDWTTATDAFFLGNGDGAKRLQQLKELKKEYTVRVAGQRVALASLNNHEDHFCRRFGIVRGDTRAQSFCLAFGLERLTVAGLFLWGARPAGWPQELRP